MKTTLEFPNRFVKQNGKLLMGCASLFLFVCCCSGVFGVFAMSNRTLRTTEKAGIIPLTGDGTAMPYPTFPSVTPLPNFTEPATQSAEVALLSPTATTVILPTATSTATITVVIIGVNKISEYVDIQNNGSTSVNLSGWILVSEKGHQSCPLGGILQPGQMLRIWPRSNSSNFSCHFTTNIWNDNEEDPGVLYNPQGQAVSRYPQ
jgi:hypothetical protein